MSKYWSPAVRDLTPYVPGEQPREHMIKLNTNENPYPPASGVEKVLRDFPADHLRRYPDPVSQSLREALAQSYSVDTAQVFVGNGSDEVLAFAFQAFFRQERPISMPAITYSFYPVYCRLYGIDYRTIALGDQWQVPLEAFTADSGGIIFANPNAPTGHGHSRESIEELLKRVSECVVVVDEAYVDFGGESVVPLIQTYPNLLVTNTFSKSRSLAGLRLGFAIGSEELIEGLERIKNSFNSYPIDSVAHAAGIAALEDTQHFEDCCSRIITTRERTRRQLQQLGFDVLPSQTNFLLVRHPQYDADQLFIALRERGILVRHFNTEALRDFLRISVGTDDEMVSLTETLSELTS
ncbi:histidinol-phosphate transaminase [Aidingimonas halophila]|uniref:Histidinol-phosphate aminotransferase n=1 Tax=Aidingimonas halophila TaxID=574349 RepID=A0A1H2Z1S0_9GAMM|nr:histidinol-phosphate transaminase [Aidingimonas halophila]GHC15127.1 histidinol-phosphate aminotransferase [Aidingimonas halophila]SDX10749.1 histidinol phosphate aminotransferase apoenzyme [Aidingimonas halophila]